MWMMLADVLVCVYVCGAVAMTIVLHKQFPELHGWGNVSRSLGWPVTVYEIASGKL